MLLRAILLTSNLVSTATFAQEDTVENVETALAIQEETTSAVVEVGPITRAANAFAKTYFDALSLVPQDPSNLSNGAYRETQLPVIQDKISELASALAQLSAEIDLANDSEAWRDYYVGENISQRGAKKFLAGFTGTVAMSKLVMVGAMTGLLPAGVLMYGMLRLVTHKNRQNRDQLGTEKYDAELAEVRAHAMRRGMKKFFKMLKDRGIDIPGWTVEAKIQNLPVFLQTTLKLKELEAAGLLSPVRCEAFLLPEKTSK